MQICLFYIQYELSMDGNKGVLEGKFSTTFKGTTYICIKDKAILKCKPFRGSMMNS